MAIDLTSPTLRICGRLGLWGAATWLVLRLREAPIAHGHSICGPWGCGPTIPALLAAHGFWLMLAIPGAIWAGRSLSARIGKTLGWICLGLGSGGIIAVGLSEFWTWHPAGHPEPRTFLTQRILFALATTVEIPLFPSLISGVLFLKAARRGDLPRLTNLEAEEGDRCSANLCGSPAAPEVLPISRPIQVGHPLPELRLFTSDGRVFERPIAAGGRATLLYFMRSPDCSICQRHVRSLENLIDRISVKDLDVFIIQPVENGSTRSFIKHVRSSFVVVSDRDSRAFDTVGLSGRNLGISPGSGTILVDGQGRIRHVRLASLPFGAFSESELTEALARLGDQGEALPEPTPRRPVQAFGSSYPQPS